MPLTCTNVKSPGPRLPAAPADFSAVLGLRETLADHFAPPPCPNPRPGCHALLLSIDNVLVETRLFRIASWQQLTEDLGFGFDPAVITTLPSLPPAEALDRLLGRAARDIDIFEKGIFLERQELHYRNLLAMLTPHDLVPGSRELLLALRHAGIKIAGLVCGSAERDLLRLLNIMDSFDALFELPQMDRPVLENIVGALAAQKPQTVIVSASTTLLTAAREARIKTLGIAESTVSHFVPDTVPNIAHITPKLLEEIATRTSLQIS